MHFGIVYRSTDGGVTWTTGSSFSAGGAFAILGNQKWAFVDNDGANYVQVSTNDGVTWSGNGSGIGYSLTSCAGDGNGTAIFASSTTAANGAWTTDGGTTFTKSTSWPFAQPLFTGCLLWDGSQFIAVVKAGANSANGDIYTAPSGFTQVAGPTWTHVGSFTNYLCFQGSAAPSAALSYSPSEGYVAMASAGGTSDPGIMFASTVAGLLTATNIVPPSWVGVDGGGASARVVLAGNGTVIGGVNSTTGTINVVDTVNSGTSWSADNSNFPNADYLAAVCLDSSNAAYIGLSSTGQIITAPGPLVTILNVTRSTLAAGTAALVAAGFTIGGVISTASSYSVGIIVGTVPPVGTAIPPGKPITLIISGGPTIAGGQSLTLNPDSFAPAGIGGDRWGANGGGITPVGNGVPGQTGYDRSVKVVASDGERQVNYIAAIPSPNQSLLQQVSIGAIDEHVSNDSLPPTNSSMG